MDTEVLLSLLCSYCCALDSFYCLTYIEVASLQMLLGLQLSPGQQYGQWSRIIVQQLEGTMLATLTYIHTANKAASQLG